MLSASHLAESLRDSVVPQLGCGVSLAEADQPGGIPQKMSSFFSYTTPSYASAAPSKFRTSTQASRNVH